MTLTVYNSSGLQKANVSTVYDTDFIGAVKAYAGATIPANWMLCDGRALSRTAYAGLFAALGGASSPWGLPDANSFNIPDLRSRMIVGTGAGTGLTARTMNGSGGEERHLLTKLEAAQADINTGADAPDHTHALPWATTAGGSSAAYAPGGTTGGTTSTSGRSTTHSHPITGFNAPNTHENMPPWVAVAWIIKVSGPQIDSGGALAGATGPQGPTGAAGGNATVPMDPWHVVGAAGEPAYGANWSSYLGTAPQYPPVAFRKDPLGVVQLRGVLLVGTAQTANAGTTAFTLPVGYRPVYRMLFDTTETVGQKTLVIYPDGTVTSGVAMTAGNGLLLDGLSFDTDTVTAMPTGPQGPAGPINGIQDEGVALPVRSKINVVGSGATATDDAANDRTVVTVPTPGETWIAWTPVPSWNTSAGTLGNSTIVARYCVAGKICYIRLFITFGSTFNGGLGAMRFALPVVQRNDGSEQYIACKLYAAINNTTWQGTCLVAGNLNPMFPISSGNASVDFLSNSGPQVPATGNYPMAQGGNLGISGYYEIA